MSATRNPAPAPYNRGNPRVRVPLKLLPDSARAAELRARREGKSRNAWIEEAVQMRLAAESKQREEAVKA